MPITTFIDPTKLPNRSQAKPEFDKNMAEFYRQLPIFGGELNALAGQVDAMVAGGAYSFAYMFDSATADADPGPGELRLSSATQSAATTLRIDVLAQGGASMSGVFDMLQAVTSAVKGAVRIVKSADPSKWLLFDVAAVGAGTGYRNMTVVHRAGSTASPFANGDALMVYIERNGDKGDLPLGGALTCLVSEALVGPLAVISYPNLFTSDYDHYLIRLSEFQSSGATNVHMRLAVAGAFVSSTVYSQQPVPHSTQVPIATNAMGLLSSTAAASPPSPGLSIDLLNVNAVDSIKMAIVDGVHTAGGGTYQSTAGLAAANILSRVSGFQLIPSGSVTFTKGKLEVFGYRNQTGPGVF